MTMKKRTLRQRLILNTVVIVMVISSLFAGGVFLMKQRLEEATFGKFVKQHLDVLVENDVATGELQNTWFDDWIYFRGESVSQLPADIRSMPEGPHHNVELRDRVYHVHVKQLPGEKVYLLYDITEWERQEHALLIAMGVGFFAVLFAALFSASKVADSILEPVRRLTAKLTLIQPGQRGLRIAPEFADSDIEQIAQAFDTYLERIDQFVEREQSFTAAASHEMRTPLSVMLGAVDVIEASGPSESGLRALQRIRRACAEMQAFIEATLLLSREENSSIQQVTEANIDEVVTQVVEDFRRDIESAGIDLELSCSAQKPIAVPASILKITIANLLRNAIEHTPGGSISLRASQHGLTIRDTGEGIAAEDLPNIFDRAYSTKPTGTGLGLNLVKRICDRFGWQLSLQSEEGRGTEVSVNFG